MEEEAWVSDDDPELNIKEEDVIFEDIEYIEEYIDSPDEPDPPGVGIIKQENAYIRTKIESIDFAEEDVQNSVWNTIRPMRSGSKARKVAQARSVPIGLAKSARSPGECLSLFLDADVIAMITEYTNERIKTEQPNYARERDANLTDETEIVALLGILYMAGTVRDGRENIEHLFDSKRGIGVEAVYLTMTSIRYHFLIRNIRFDDPATALDDTENDKLAPIRAIYERVISNCQKYFRPGRIMSLSEQLIQFKGACEFRQHLPQADGKMGFKYHLLVDCDTSYISNLEICVPNNHNPYNLSYAPIDVAMRMTEPIQGKHKTVVLGPTFTSRELIKKLYDSRTMVIGEVDKSNQDIPKAFTSCKGRPPNCTLSAYHDSISLISHVTKRKEVLLLMSSLTEDDTETNGETDLDQLQAQQMHLVELYIRMSNTIRDVKKTYTKYDVTRSTRQWPLAVFFNLMNLCAINAWCIYQLNHPNEDKQDVRRDFMIDMALEFLRPMARRRMDNKTIPRTLKQRIAMFLGLNREEYDFVPALENRRGGRGRCFLCGRARNKTTRISCHNCGSIFIELNNTHATALCHPIAMEYGRVRTVCVRARSLYAGVWHVKAQGEKDAPRMWLRRDERNAASAE
uniref:PiggyBac transposable element-derived protein domain-containing protein n=1 Tax=Anopheles farauti TaxID=69004 RepID=A0A182Q5E5_9DIPT